MDKKRKRQEIIVRIICVFLAFGLWLYINNSEDVQKTRVISDVNVELMNEQSLKAFGLAIAPDKKGVKVDLEIQGKAVDIYSAKPESFRVAVDLSKYALKRGENNIYVEIIESPANVVIINSASLKATITVDNLVERNFEITPDIKVKTKSGSFTGEPDIKNKNVTISGAAGTVNKVSKVVAQGEVNDVENDVTQNFALKALDSEGKEVQGLTMNINEVEVYIPVRKAKPVKINVKTTGTLPEDYMLDYINPENNYVEITGSDDVLSKISRIDTSAVDLSKIKSTSNVTVDLIVPSGITIVGENKAVNVKVGVSKKATKEINVKYSIKGLSNEFNIEGNPETVKVVLKGSQETLNKINKDNIKCEINLSEYGEGEYEIDPKVTLPNNDAEIVSVEKVSIKLLKK